MPVIGPDDRARVQIDLGRFSESRVRVGGEIRVAEEREGELVRVHLE